MGSIMIAVPDCDSGDETQFLVTTEFVEKKMRKEKPRRRVKRERDDLSCLLAGALAFEVSINKGRELEWLAQLLLC